MKVVRAAWACGAAMAVAGCGHGAGIHSGTAGAVDLDSIPVLPVRRDLRVGSAANPDSGFSRIGPVTVGPDSLVYVLDTQERQVRVFDPSGRRVRTIGREGEGPGEFGAPVEMGFKKDTLWVFDYRENRTTLFRRTGTVLATIPTATVMLNLSGALDLVVQGGMPRPDGRMGISFMSYRLGRAGKRPDSVMVPELVFDRKKQVVDTLGFSPLMLPRSTTVVLDGKRLRVPAAPPDYPLRTRDPRGMVVVERPTAASATKGTLVVTRTGPSGDTLFHRTYAYRPHAFPAGEADSLVRMSVPYAMRVTGRDSAVVEKALRDAVHLPTFQTPVSMTRLGADGSVWLRREDDGKPAFRWDVLDPSGEPVGQIDLPRSVSIRWARMGEIYGVAVDSLGIPWLVRYRVGAS